MMLRAAVRLICVITAAHGFILFASSDGFQDVSPTIQTLNAPYLRRLTLENYRIQLENTNKALDVLRTDVETWRMNSEIDLDGYHIVMGKYRAGVKTYKSGIANYRKFMLTPDLATSLSDSLLGNLLTARVGLADARITSLERMQAPSEDVASFGADSKQALVSALAGRDLEALSSYVEDRFPQKKEDTEFTSYADAVRELQAQISDVANNPTINLTVASTPSGAHVVIRPKYGTQQRAGATDMLFQNLRRGLYTLSVSLAGYRPYSDDLNLLDDVQPLLTCTMNPEAGQVDSSCVRRQ